jgi:16S rRNA (uracil1498-N3)-methyltransferase
LADAITLKREVCSQGGNQVLHYPPQTLFVAFTFRILTLCFFLPMHLFFAPQFSAENPFLPEEEASHALKVLRLSPGENVQITDGRGNWYQAMLVTADPRKCKLRVLRHDPEYGKKNYGVHIAVAPTKNADRTEWLVEKCVEIGVEEISFVQCDRSERKHFKIDRLQKIAVAATKQSLKAYLPRLNELAAFIGFLKKDLPANRYIAHLAEGERHLLQHMAPKNSNCCVLIGPEGDFTPAEVKAATENGFQPVSLGESRLRTETAGVAACHILNLINT